jgi:hypothetical protein
MRKRLAAFTVPELMVVMLLSGIVISAMYLLLQFSFTNYFRYYKSTEKMNRISRMDYLLTKDVNTSAVLQKTADGFSFTEYDKKITYQIIDSVLIRTDQFADTLAASAITCELFRDGVPVTDASAMADHIQLTLTYKEDELIMQYQKNIDAKGYLLIEETYGTTGK